MAASVQSSSNAGSGLFFPDGRQTRIDFFSSGKSGNKDAHIVHSRKSTYEWWHTLTAWLKASPKEKEHQMEEFSHFLEEKQYSKKTCRTYLFMVRKFLSYLDQKGSAEITIGSIEDYNYDFFVSGRYSRSYQLQFINGMALYLEFIHGIKVNLKGLRRSETGRKK